MLRLNQKRGQCVPMEISVERQFLGWGGMNKKLRFSASNNKEMIK